MIIKREYVPFITLINTDPDAKVLFMECFEISYASMDNESRMNCFDYLAPKCLYQREMDWCFKENGSLIEGFKKLDKEKPYDNGFTYTDVTRVDIADSNEHGLTLHLKHVYYGFESIVAIETVGKRL